DPAAIDSLGYEVVEHDLTQPRMTRRKSALPQIGLGAYNYDAVIDWIELEIRTHRRTNWVTVQDRIPAVPDRRPHVRNLNGASHGADTAFRAIIQDPSRQQLMAMERMLAGSHF